MAWCVLAADDMLVLMAPKTLHTHVHRRMCTCVFLRMFSADDETNAQQYPTGAEETLSARIVPISKHKTIRNIILLHSILFSPHTHFDRILFLSHLEQHGFACSARPMRRCSGKDVDILSNSQQKDRQRQKSIYSNQKIHQNWKHMRFVPHKNQRKKRRRERKNQDTAFFRCIRDCAILRRKGSSKKKTLTSFLLFTKTVSVERKQKRSKSERLKETDSIMCTHSRWRDGVQCREQKNSDVVILLVFRFLFSLALLCIYAII